ncbi:hypothetical protein [Streptomyces sp. HP-A2021]|uniref:hypothetical protein n=1 Tax=Streptomyces sp. HP-A2021 TaxID=2927875 RepID=UPI00325FB2AD
MDVSLPSEHGPVFEWDKPKDKNEAAAMEDAANYFRAIYRGVAKRTTKDPAVTAYAAGDGVHYAGTQINAWIDGGWTATGTLRHYDAATCSATNRKSVDVAFCADTGKFYGKEVKTDKNLKTKPIIEDFDYFKIVTVKFPTVMEPWQASRCSSRPRRRSAGEPVTPWSLGTSAPDDAHCGARGHPCIGTIKAQQAPQGPIQTDHPGSSSSSRGRSPERGRSGRGVDHKPSGKSNITHVCIKVQYGETENLTDTFRSLD